MDQLLVEREDTITEEMDGCTFIQVTGYDKAQLILKGSPYEVEGVIHLHGLLEKMEVQKRTC